MSQQKKRNPARPERDIQQPILNMEYRNPGKERSIPTSMLASGLPYQRPVDEKAVDRLIQNWDDRLLDPTTVSYREGRFNVVDGQHRVAAISRHIRTYEKIGKNLYILYAKYRKQCYGSVREYET